MVHDVGEFEASFVPTPADFNRLDERFRLPRSVWSALPDYADYGFAVFKLPPEALWLLHAPPRGWTELPPDGVRLPRRNPSALFFPTVHVHDGAVHAEADFDHTLYMQLDSMQSEPGLEQRVQWQRSR